MKFLLIFFGGGLGSVLRYAIDRFFNTLEISIPYGTLLVNVLGSFIIGLLIGFSYKNPVLNENQLLFLTVGFCGGFTTFSAFTLENSSLLKNGDYLHFFLYTFGTIFLGVLAVVIGLAISK